MAAHHHGDLLRLFADHGLAALWALRAGRPVSGPVRALPQPDRSPRAVAGGMASPDRSIRADARLYPGHGPAAVGQRHRPALLSHGHADAGDAYRSHGR